MTSPFKTIFIRCPKCDYFYGDCYRPSINLSLDNFDDEYIDEVTSTTCPNCEHKVKFEALVVNKDGEFCIQS